MIRSLRSSTEITKRIAASILAFWVYQIGTAPRRSLPVMYSHPSGPKLPPELLIGLKDCHNASGYIHDLATDLQIAVLANTHLK